MTGLVSTSRLREDLQRDIARLKDAAAEWHRKKPKLQGYPTGLGKLDEFTGGLVPGEAVILAADPGGGKTSMMMQAVEHSALYYHAEGLDYINLVISAEMPRRTLYMRSACRLANVDTIALRRGNVTPAQLAAFESALAYLESLPFLVEDTPGITSDLIVQLVRDVVHEGVKLGVVAVDYIQQLYDDGADGTTRINHIMSNLMRVKQESEAAMLLLSQYNYKRSTDKRRMPDLGDLLGSGNIGRAADQAWLMFEPELAEKWQGGGANSYRKDVNIAKNRNGSTGQISLWYCPSKTYFFSDDSERQRMLNQGANRTLSLLKPRSASPEVASS